MFSMYSQFCIVGLQLAAPLEKVMKPLGGGACSRKDTTAVDFQNLGLCFSLICCLCFLPLDEDVISQLPALLPSLHQYGFSDWRVINSYNHKSEFLSIRFGTGE